MNDYDKASRYLVKRDSAGFLRWLLRNPAVRFHAWIDARRLALPDQNDLTNDLVAALQVAGGYEALCIEIQAEARDDMLTRLLSYEARLWAEPGDDRALPLACVGGVVLNMTGRGRIRELILRPTLAPEARLELAVQFRDLRDEEAADLTAGVAVGTISPWQLAWAPLMRGGAEAGIIEAWRCAAERSFAEERDRNLLGLLTLTFSQLARCRPAWEHGLRRWNMQTSPLWDEIRAEGRELGREEGREEGRVVGARAMLLRQGRRKFGKIPTRKQQRELADITDLARLEALADRLLDAASWAEMLNGA